MGGWRFNWAVGSLIPPHIIVIPNLFRDNSRRRVILKQVQDDELACRIDRYFSLRHAELGSASILQRKSKGREAEWTLKRVQGDEGVKWGDSIPQACHAFSLILGNQRIDHLGQTAAFQYLGQFMQREVDPMVSHAALREIIGADAF